MSDPTAVVREVDGHLVLDDPEALAVIGAIEKHNCTKTLSQNAERIQHFKNRVTELGKKPEDVVIVVINVDDPHGGPLADILMPGTNWQQIRNQGQVPFARGLAVRSGIEEFLDLVDPKEAAALRSLTGLAVVVVDYSTAVVFQIK